MGAMTAGIFDVAGTTMALYQSHQQTQLKKLEARLAADSLEAQASRKELEAAEVMKMADLDLAEQAIATRLDQASRRVEYAASGVKVDSGSAVTVAADKAAWGEYARQKIEYEAGLASWGLGYDAALLKQEAANTRAAGVTSGSGVQTLVQGVGTLFSRYG